MMKIFVGVFSLALATILLIDKAPGVTGSVISTSNNSNLPSVCGLVLLICAIGLFALDARERMEK